MKSAIYEGDMSKIEENESESERVLYITANWVSIILIYYLLCFIAGLAMAVFVLCDWQVSGYSYFEKALIGSIFIALNSSSIAYIRKLYKLCFKVKTDHNYEDQLKMKRIGTIIYFLARPLFSVSFAVFLVLGLRSGMMLSAASVEYSEGFVYICMFISYFIGFLSGYFINRIEEKGKIFLDKKVV